MSFKAATLKVIQVRTSDRPIARFAESLFADVLIDLVFVDRAAIKMLKANTAVRPKNIAIWFSKKIAPAVVPANSASISMAWQGHVNNAKNAQNPVFIFSPFALISYHPRIQ